jgi:catechol 2,3-dioxygenase-like lactoylglutathione lyase family enzyme
MNDPLLEHVALAMPDPAAAAEWYARNLGCTLVRASSEPPYAHFLRPRGSGVLIELFRHDDATPPDYRKVHAMAAHLAFAVDDVDAAIERLIAADAIADLDPVATPAGDRFGVVRDPWGVPLQLITRAVAFEPPGEEGDGE